MIYDIPPELRGSPQQQIAALRDYLVRLARTSAQTGGDNQAALQNGATLNPGGGSQQKAVSEEELQRAASVLRGLVRKTADELGIRIEDTEQTALSETAALAEQIRSSYLLQSEFGMWRQEILRTIEETANAIEETYRLEELLQSVDGLETYMLLNEGQIRRGYIADPDNNNELVLGIAISSRLSMDTANTVTREEGGVTVTYTHIDAGQSFGLYTAEGWQFWLNGRKAGWFSSRDGQLHVRKITVEESITQGQWMVVTGSGYGIRYLG